MRCGIEAETVANAITDGMKDCGIDAIYKDGDTKTLYLVQAKWSKDGQGTIQVLPNESEEAIIRLELRINDDVSELLTNETILLNDVYGFMAHSSNNQDILIDDVLINNWGTISDIDGTHRGYYGMVNAGQIAEWWKRYGNTLLDKNIRFFKGDTEVNKGIIKTLIEEPEKFIYYNNGIKLIAKKVTRKLAHSADRDTGLFHLKGVSIVNGAQTTGSIGESYIGMRT